jgi:hypothetical protein
LGQAQFTPGYLTTPNDDQQRFNAQVAAMNPAVTITAPVRVIQAADDARVYANPAPYPGTDTLITELTAANPAGTITYQRYPAGTVPPRPRPRRAFRHDQLRHPGSPGLARQLLRLTTGDRARRGRGWRAA